MARFSKQDWLDLAHKQLIDEGAAGLLLERICAAAKKTRGSFYHHFVDHDAFINAVMAHWQMKQTDEIIVDVESETNVKQRKQRLSQRAIDANHKLESAIRHFAQSHSGAAEFLKKVDEKRIAYLEKLILDERKCSKKQAKRLAEIEYAAFVGAMILWPDKPRSHSAELDELLSQLVAAFFEKQKDTG